MSTAIQQMQTYGPGVTLRITDGEQYDVIRDGRHVGTVMDTGPSRTDGEPRYSARAFVRPPRKAGMLATRSSLSEAVTYILERSV
jgi:hypothetical protein